MEKNRSPKLKWEKNSSYKNYEKVTKQTTQYDGINFKGMKSWQAVASSL